MKTIVTTVLGALAFATFTHADVIFSDSEFSNGDWELTTYANDKGDDTTAVHSNSGGNPPNSGAAYVFVRNGTNWTQQAYLKASNARANSYFGAGLAISGDTIIVGSQGEDGGADGVNGDQSKPNAFESGAAYIFVRQETNWIRISPLHGD